MGQDLRELFKKQREKERFALKEGHEERFLSRLEEELSEKKETTGFPWLKIAAAVLVLVATGTFFLTQKQQPIAPAIVDVPKNVEASAPTISFGDLSPELKRVEDYYVATINYELSSLEVSEENEELGNSYLERLGELNKEYQALNTELNEVGPNDQTIEAAIRNLQLRLELMKKLKSKLNQLKSSENEQQETTII